jgi:hypothetical protein
MHTGRFVSAVTFVFVVACHDHGSAPSAAASATVAASASAAGAASTAGLPASITYSTYKNPRYGYTVDVASIFSVPEPVRGDAGQLWTWGSRAQMSIVTVDGKGRSITDWFADSKQEPGYASGNLTGSAFSTTGRANGKSFWQRTLLQGGRLYSVRVECNEGDKAFFDPIATRVGESLKAPASDAAPG